MVSGYADQTTIPNRSERQSMECYQRNASKSKTGARPRTLEMREVVNGILYLVGRRHSVANATKKMDQIREKNRKMEKTLSIPADSELRRLSTHDMLTGLYNHGFFLAEM